jgi:cytochrome c-type biogenesis protein CcmH
MIGFWIAAALVSAAAALLILWRAGRARADVSAHATRGVYARQLDEIDDLAARGLIAEPERQAARAEAGRRLIGAARQEDAAVGAAAPGAGRRIALACAVAAPLLAVAVYLVIGSPQRPDQPFAKRLAAWRRADPASLDAQRMSALLEQLTQERPKDAQLLVFLARAEAAQDQMPLAVRTLQRAARLAPERADVWAQIGEGLLEMNGGEMTPDARDAFEHSLRIDPKTPLARYQLARADIAAGRADQGLAVWRALAAQLAVGDPRRADLESEIAAVARTGRLPAPAAAAPAPSSDEQRAFIQSMVDRLAARLKTQPDDPAGWARLIHAYGVLGEEDRRQAAIAEVRRRYVARPDVVKSILDPH